MVNYITTYHEGRHEFLSLHVPLTKQTLLRHLDARITSRLTGLTLKCSQNTFVMGAAILLEILPCGVMTYESDVRGKAENVSD